MVQIWTPCVEPPARSSLSILRAIQTDIKFLFQNIQGLAEQAMAQWLIHLSMMGYMYMILLNLMDVTTERCVRRRVLSFNSMYVVMHTFYCYLTAPITKFLVSEYFSDDGTGRLASLTVLINKQQISFVSAYANMIE